MQEKTKENRAKQNRKGQCDFMQVFVFNTYPENSANMQKGKRIEQNLHCINYRDNQKMF